MDQAGLVRFPSFSFFISFTFQFLPTLQGSKPPLDVADKLTDPFPPSPLFSTANTLNSPLLPPFKFHPALLQPRNLAFATGGYGAGPDDSYESMDDANFSDEELSAPNNLDFSDSPTPHNYDEEQLFPCKGRREILKTGLADQSLTIQVPNTVRRFTDGEMGFNKCLQRNLTPAAAAPVQLQKQVHLRNVNCPDDDTVGLGTPLPSLILNFRWRGIQNAP